MAAQAAGAIETQAVIAIGEQFAKAKENLRYLRNGNGWVEWCDKRLGISHTKAQHYINAYENRESLKNLSTFGKSVLFMLTAERNLDGFIELCDEYSTVSRKIISNGQTMAVYLKHLMEPYQEDNPLITVKEVLALLSNQQEEEKETETEPLQQA